jgi:hypothetical protein
MEKKPKNNERGNNPTSKLNKLGRCVTGLVRQVDNLMIRSANAIDVRAMKAHMRSENEKVIAAATMDEYSASPEDMSRMFESRGTHIAMKAMQQVEIPEGTDFEGYLNIATARQLQLLKKNEQKDHI